jgi:hypothetical protein
MSSERKSLKSAILVFLALASLGLTTACLIPGGEGRGRGREEHGGAFHEHEGHDEHGGHPEHGGREYHPE